MERERDIPLHARLGFRIALPFAVFIVAVLAIFSWGSYYAYTQQRENALLIPKTMAETKSAALGSFFRYLQLDLRLAARAIEHIRAPDESSKRLIKNIVRDNFATLELAYYDARGEAFYHEAKPTVDASLIAKSIHNDPYFESVLQRGVPLLGDPVFPKPETPYAFWYFPVRDTSGRVAGVMRATIDLSTLWNFLVQDATSNDDVYIVDARGMYVVGNTYHPIGGTSLVNNAAVNAFLYGTPRVPGYEGIAGVPVVGSWKALPPTSWGIVVETPQSEFSSALRQQLAIFIVLFDVLIALALYEFFIVRRELFRPLTTLIEKMSEFGAGNYKARVHLPVTNELSFLAFVFNQMAENIDRETSAIIERLRRVVAEQDVGAKLLVRRDLELVRANEKLREVGRMKSEFVSVVAHQLRTPLSAIKWIFKMLINDDVGPLNIEQKTLAIKGYESNERLIALVNDLLDIDRLESGAMQFVFSPVDLLPILQNLLLELEVRARAKSITIKVEPFDIPKIRADQVKLRAVLQNLIENAVKYTPDRGTVAVSVTESDGRYALVSIADTGMGIPADQQDQIFAKFFRGRNAQREVAEGTGLGLSLVKSIVERHGGTIWFESEEGKGSTFRFTIPLA